MNNWKKIWESRKDNLGSVDPENYREVFAELKRIDGFDLNGGVSLDSQIRQHENLKTALNLSAGAKMNGNIYRGLLSS